MTKGKLLWAIALASMPSVVLGQSASTMAANARRIMTGRLIDPGSLVIRNTVLKTVASTGGQRVTILCGEYNAKNRFGGYTGFKTFIYEPKLMRGVLSVDQAMALDFMSADGSGDISHDPEGAIRAGADPSTLAARHRKATDFAIKYLPTCLGAA